MIYNRSRSITLLFARLERVFNAVLKVILEWFMVTKRFILDRINSMWLSYSALLSYVNVIFEHTAEFSDEFYTRKDNFSSIAEVLRKIIESEVRTLNVEVHFVHLLEKFIFIFSQFQVAVTRSVLWLGRWLTYQWSQYWNSRSET